ncbi:MAG: hypothetical protein HQ528_09225 [Candidatus Marinimicrobia bacterium]|nr:hypothetical protein [Candidatus Neomarinimicrobiota bacterium]
MPVTTSYNKNGRFIHHILNGDITGVDIIEAFDNSLAVPDVKPDFHVIWDFREVHLPNLTDTMNQLKALAGYIKSKERNRSEGYKVALVSGTDLLFGMARMYQVVASSLPVHFRGFRKFKEAESWILSIAN